jgi:hypothetical protein
VKGRGIVVVGPGPGQPRGRIGQRRFDTHDDVADQAHPRRPGRIWPRHHRASRPYGLLEIMTSIVLRVRLMAGDRLDVSYDEPDTADAADVAEVAALADPAGMIRAKHGDRVVVLYGRGVAAIEMEPRGAVL